MLSVLPHARLFIFGKNILYLPAVVHRYKYDTTIKSICQARARKGLKNDCLLHFNVEIT